MGVCLQLLGRVAADDGLYVGAEGALRFRVHDYSGSEWGVNRGVNGE
jgi:hypothetical protein